LHDQAVAELRAARLQQASETLIKALDELGGTKWGACSRQTGLRW